jgi:uroporphyrinogen-III synthase
MTGTYDLVVFVSVHAVEHGATHIVRTENMRIAAIGNATAASLKVAGLEANVVPEHGFRSEDLLAHPDLNIQTHSRVLIVRGRGGRELLRETFIHHGCHVDTLEVYERTLPQWDAARRDELENMWASGGIHAATATSVETLQNLQSLLSDRGKQLLASTPLVMPSVRIAEAARELGLRADCILASGADDESIIYALGRWHSRARMSAIRAG